MEINKQLFEDVLSGKLKGTFVLRCGIKISSDELSFNNDYDKEKYPYTLWKFSYTPEGYFHVGEWTGGLSIIDFIPDTDMKENELTIEIPNDKVVDWDESKKQNRIVLKDKQLTYEDICKKLFKEIAYYTDIYGSINSIVYETDERIADPNNATTKHQLECILAKNKLANVAKYLNDGWKLSKTDFGYFKPWILFMTPNKDYIGSVEISNCASNNVLFKSKELAQQAIEILGEETVKLVLEPLGI